MEKKLCVNCIYYAYTFDYHFCKHPKSIKTDLVTGELSYKDCYDLRTIGANDFQNHCGALGKWWKAKDNVDT